MPVVDYTDKYINIRFARIAFYGTASYDAFA